VNGQGSLLSYSRRDFQLPWIIPQALPSVKFYNEMPRNNLQVEPITRLIPLLSEPLGVTLTNHLQMQNLFQQFCGLFLPFGTATLSPEGDHLQSSV
jgi:hypothetical protein